MKILGIESSGHVASAALIEDDKLRAGFTLNNGLTHSETLMPMLSEMMSFSRERIEDVDAVAVSAGPGSFTGLRIGAATAKGLALGLSCPIVSVSSLHAMAFNLESSYGNLICPIMDARRGQVYCAAFKDGERLLSDDAMSMEGLLEKLSAYKDCANRMIFLGDGVPVYKELITERLKESCAFAASDNALQRAASVAQLGLWQYKDWLRKNSLELSYMNENALEDIKCFNDIVMDPDDFVPRYIRKPQAQRELEAGMLEDPGLHSLKKMNGEKHGRRDHTS